MPNCNIGQNCNVLQNAVISSDVVLGSNVKAQNNVSIYTRVTCDEDVFLELSMVFTNVINPRSAINKKNEYMKTHVGKGAVIGANATIVCGYDRGKFAFISEGAVVTKEVPDYSLVVGNRSRQIGGMSECGQKLNFDKDGKAQCVESKEWYQIIDGKVIKR